MALFEVPVRDAVRDLLHDAEARQGGRGSRSVASGAVEELRQRSLRDIPVALEGGPGAGRPQLRARLCEAAVEYARAAEDVLVRHLAQLDG